MSDTPQEPRQSYSERAGWDDVRLAASNEAHSTRINRVELDVLLAHADGHDEVATCVSATGLTVGQVRHARGVLVAQGLIEEPVDA